MNFHDKEDSGVNEQAVINKACRKLGVIRYDNEK